MYFLHSIFICYRKYLKVMPFNNKQGTSGLHQFAFTYGVLNTFKRLHSTSIMWGEEDNDVQNEDYWGYEQIETTTLVSMTGEMPPPLKRRRRKQC